MATNKNLKELEFVKSLAGHDKDEIYVILQIEEDICYVADGKSKTIEKPKKKKMKHLQPIHIIDQELQTKLDSLGHLQNEDIKRAIKIYLASQSR